MRALEGLQAELVRVEDYIRELQTEVRELRAEVKALAHANGEACDTIADRDRTIEELQQMLYRRVG